MALFDQLKIPVIVSPMFLVSGKELVIAACKSGVFGTFPALNCRTTNAFAEWLKEIKTAVDGRPFGVNLIVHKTNPRLQEDLKICIKEKVPLIITSLGAVREIVEAVHSYGGLIFHDVTQVRHAQKAAEAGVDGLILVSAGAGGHAGTINPFALISEVRAFFKKKIVLAGAISKGEQILAAQIAGADLAYMGTRFIPTTESLAQPEYKEMIVQSNSMDVVYTPQVSGIPANFLRASLDKAGYGAGTAHTPSLSLEAEAKAWRDVWSAGHGVGAINKVESVEAVVGQLLTEYKSAFALVNSLSAKP